MKVPRVVKAMEYIDDDLITAAATYAPKKKKPAWVKWGAMAACLCLMVMVAIPVVNFFTEYQTDDPNWEKTHYETSVLSEIEAVCGTDLLIDKMAQADKGYKNYHLEIVENGSFDKKADWKSLTVDVSYGDSIFDKFSDSDSIVYFVSFDGDISGNNINDFLTEAAEMDINGYTVEYREASAEELTADGINYGYKQGYHGWAKFTHNGYTYYLATNSDSSDFFTEVINQLLG